ncbi:MAG: hypothetical protein Q8R67_06275 [Rhodoferax sp.]|nr:hypothetical protein [Rhodoferax sp.]MDP3651271.1 hypothetical protein [Rhodoferax sp.]
MVCSKMHGTQWLATGLSAFTLAFAAMAPSQAATVAAVPGWNLLGYSDAAAVKVSDAFGDATKLTTVWKWDAASSKWAFYSPSFATPTDLANYAASKGYLVLTTINSGEGFWVNAKTSFSATLPAASVQVANTEALAGIQATLTALTNLYATAIPSAGDLGGLFDATFLYEGKNKADTVQRWISENNGPSVGLALGSVALVNPVDVGQVNDASHQWVTFSDANGEGPGSPWLTIKQSDGKWLLAGDQRMFGLDVGTQAVKHIESAQNGGQVTYQNKLYLGVDSGMPAGVVDQVVVSGPGVLPSSGVLVYSAAQGNNWIPSCGDNQSVTNCVDVSQVTAGAQYTFKAYTAAGGTTVPTYTYVTTLSKAPLSAVGLAAASFPTITNVSGSWAPGTQVSVSWTLPAGSQSSYIDVGAWPSQGGSLFSGVGIRLSTSGTSATITLPSYSGTIYGRHVWLTTYDANGNQLSVDYKMSAP